jgi:hypothetical protein
MKLVSILSILPILSKNQLSIGESESSQINPSRIRSP